VREEEQKLNHLKGRKISTSKKGTWFMLKQFSSAKVGFSVVILPFSLLILFLSGVILSLSLSHFF